MTAHEATQRVDVFVAGLRKTGLRLTHQRLEVVREIAASENHPDVETIYSRVRKRVPTLSLDTVYRTFATLVDLGLVGRVTALPGAARYDADPRPHHHFVCTQCGSLRDVFSPGLAGFGAPAEAMVLGRVDSVSILFMGLCHECLARRDREKEMSDGR